MKTAIFLWTGALVLAAGTSFAQVPSKVSPAQAKLSGPAPAQVKQTAKPGASVTGVPAYRQGLTSAPLVTTVPPPAPLVGGTDDCTTPDVIVGQGNFVFDNTLATTGVIGQAEGICNQLGAGTAILNDVWFTWTAPLSGTAILETCNVTSVDTKIAVYDGSTCPGTAALVCNDDNCSFTFQSNVMFPVVGGNSYLIQLGNYPGNFPPATPGVGSFNLNVVLPPPNDDCTTPTVVAGVGSFPFDNTVATVGIQGQTETSCLFYGSTSVNNDVWFTWTAGHSGFAGVETCATAIDTKIAVYAGAGCPTAGTAIGCNDDTCGLQSRVVFPCVAGQQYTIQLGLYPFTTLGGAATFDMIVVVPPSNDDCTTPVSLATSVPTAWDNTYATTGVVGQTEPLCFNAGSTNLYNDMWYTWTATFSGQAGARTCGSTFNDTRIAVYDGVGCPVNPAIACVDDACALQTLTLFPCVLGQSYTIHLGMYSTFDIGTGTIEVIDAAPPANDGCTTPTAIAGSGPFPFDNTFATTGIEGQAEALCTLLGGSNVNNDVWYTWTAPNSGSFQVQTLGLTLVDTKIGVYDGAGCPANPSIACNDDANDPFQVYLQSSTPFAATAGQTYTIQLGLYWASFAGGSGEFSIMPVGTPANDNCATPDVVSGFGPHFFDNTQCTTGIEGQAEVNCLFYTNTAVVEDAWYVWSGTSSGTATLTVCGSTVTDTKISVYDGSGCPTNASLACADDSCGATFFQSEVQFPVTCGQSYTIQIGCYPNYGAPTGGQGRFTVDVTGGAPCQTGTVYCPGDGTGTACPCGNNSTLGAGAGCINSLSGAGTLRGNGNASVSGDTLLLTATQIPNGPGLYFQGTLQVNGGNGVVFGDGLRCAGGTIIRLGIVTAAGNTSTYPSPNPPAVNAIPISLKGLNVAGNVRNYQLWYRDSAAFCTAAVFNLTNALNLTWQP